MGIEMGENLKMDGEHCLLIKSDGCLYFAEKKDIIFDAEVDGETVYEFEGSEPVIDDNGNSEEEEEDYEIPKKTIEKIAENIIHILSGYFDDECHNEESPCLFNLSIADLDEMFIAADSDNVSAQTKTKRARTKTNQLIESITHLDARWARGLKENEVLAMCGYGGVNMYLEVAEQYPISQEPIFTSLIKRPDAGSRKIHVQLPCRPMRASSEVSNTFVEVNGKRQKEATSPDPFRTSPGSLR